MQRNKMGSVGDWRTFDGSAVFTVDGVGGRGLRFEVVTTGADVFVDDDEGSALVFSGIGRCDIDCGVTGNASIRVDCEGTSSIRIEGNRPGPVGWTNEPSITDLEPKRFGAVSPEVQAMFDQMQRNMLERERRLLEAIQSKKSS